MRKISLFIASSLDGFIATPSGGVDWLFTDKDYGYNDFFARVDTVLMGRKTYEQVLGFGEYPYKGKESFVFTRSPGKEKDDNVSFIRDNIPHFIESLRSSLGKDIWLVGGAEIVKLFLQHNWIDEFIISIHPIILGDGIPLFLPTQGQSKSLSLQHAQTFDTGLVQLSYRRSNEIAVSYHAAPDGI